MSMTDKVIPLFKAKEEPEVHVTGTCFCFSCKHEWTAAMPAGTTELQCPKCNAMKGKMKFECIRINESHYICGCGNQYFSITPTNIYCPNCGADQRPYD